MRRIRIMLLALLCVGLSSPLFAVETVKKTSTVDNFTSNITAKAFDRYVGEFYTGLATDDTTDVKYTISKAGRSDTTFTGLAGTTATACQVLNAQMAIASTDGTAAAWVGFKNKDDATSGALSATSATAISATTAKTGANQIKLTDGNNATKISKIAGGYYNGTDIAGGTNANTPAGAYFFTKVQATNDISALGGIEAFRFVTATTIYRIGTGTFASPESPNALAYNLTIGQINGDGAPLRKGSNQTALANDANSFVANMYWNSELKTLFIASNVYTLAQPAAGANRDFYVAISKVTFNSTNDALMIISDVIPHDKNALSNRDTTIFTSSKNPNTSAVGTFSPKLHKIRTMKTSTNLHYLIVNGKVVSTGATTTGNEFWALRYNPTAAATITGNDNTKGQIIPNNSLGFTLENHFTLTDAAGVTTKGLDGGNTGSLQVGGQTAPWQPAYTANDMEVVGDTVYVSMSGSVRDANNDPGVWASTAMFDKDGVIIGWTAWERVMPALGGITTYEDKAHFFSVDAKNNKLWAVIPGAADDAKKVVRMKWADGVATAFTDNSLVDSLYKKFRALTYKNCICVLDIPKSTPGIYGTSTSAASLALFGGYEKVYFARTQYLSGGIIIPTAINGFADGANFLETPLPSGAATVRCLGYSRRVANENSSYFFAGTDKGLWAYCHPTTFAGFNGSTGLTTLAAAPFTDDPNSFAWKQLFASDIKGAVTAIDADGTYVYVVEQDLTTVGGFTSKLWRLPLGIVATSMTPVLIAQSGLDEIPANTIFTGFKFITDAQGVRDIDASGKSAHRGIISTNLGLIQSSEALANLTTAGNNAPNTWIAVSSSRAYRSLYSPKRVPATPASNDGACHKVFANAFYDAENNWYQNSSYHQFGSNVTMNDTGENTRNASGYINYTNRDMATGTSRKNYVDRSMNFWTDGGRRFYTRFNASEWVADKTKPNMLESLPFDAQQWNMSTPYKTSDVETENIYWIENISGLGIILAGTGNGVIALE
ncbi:hypothetical protein L6269_01680 [Candidatus Dependentiae bacterium]|nr:hypothetical protein [Candidatus Dependentiae bacterium]